MLSRHSLGALVSYTLLLVHPWRSDPANPSGLQTFPALSRRVVSLSRLAEARAAAYMMELDIDCVQQKAECQEANNATDR
jgi:hypothetical protein